MDATSRLSHGPISVRLVRPKDARALQRELADNRGWLSPWEATSPDGGVPLEMRTSIRRLMQQHRDGLGIPLVMEYAGELCGQLNVWGISRGSLSSATIGYWISERFAGRGITTTAVAIATDLCFGEYGLHRVEICIRPENAPSLRVVQKLGFRYEGLRRGFIHIDGAWRDHHCFALLREEVPEGVLARWVAGRVPPSTAPV